MSYTSISNNIVTILVRLWSEIQVCTFNFLMDTWKWCTIQRSHDTHLFSSIREKCFVRQMVKRIHLSCVWFCWLLIVLWWFCDLLWEISVLIILCFKPHIFLNTLCQNSNDELKFLIIIINDSFNLYITYYDLF